MNSLSRGSGYSKIYFWLGLVLSVGLFGTQSALAFDTYDPECGTLIYTYHHYPEVTTYEYPVAYCNDPMGAYYGPSDRPKSYMSADLYIGDEKVPFAGAMHVDELPYVDSYEIVPTRPDTATTTYEFNNEHITFHAPENVFISDSRKGHDIEYSEEMRFEDPGVYSLWMRVHERLVDSEITDDMEPWNITVDSWYYATVFEVIDTSDDDAPDTYFDEHVVEYRDDLNPSDFDEDDESSDDEEESEEEDDESGDGTEDEDEHDEETGSEDEDAADDEDEEGAGEEEGAEDEDDEESASDEESDEDAADDEETTTDGASNVLFLPGIMGSHLYEDDGACSLTGGEQRRWFSVSACDQMRLTTDFLGRSQHPIYTKSEEGAIVDSTFMVLNLYSTFLDNLASWKDEGVIVDYRAVPYDWRLRLDEIIQTTRSDDGKISYEVGASYQDSYLYESLSDLVDTSHSGSVTIVAHSNGGLLTKVFLEALQQNDDPLADKVDNVVLVGVPQVGTPGSAVGMLHGDSVGPWGWVVSQEVSRTLLNNMPFAHHLLPQNQYFNDTNITVETPVISIEHGTATAAWRERHGDELTDQAAMRSFMQDTDRFAPEADELDMPAVVDTDFNNYVDVVQTILRNWQPGSETQVHQIAGTGLSTPAGVTYFNKTVCESREILLPLRCAEYGDELGYRVEHTRDGDQTVVTPSAVAMSENENVHRWGINLFEYNSENSDIRHRDLLEMPELNEFIYDTITDQPTTYQHIQSGLPSPATGHVLEFQLHSPLDMRVNLGDGTVISSSTDEVSQGSYRRYGEVQYITAPTQEVENVELAGQSSGSFTLDVTERAGAAVVASTSFRGVPSESDTLATLEFAENIENSTLSVDYAGDDEIVVSYTASTLGPAEPAMIEGEQEEGDSSAAEDDDTEVSNVPYQSGGSARIPETQPAGQVAGEAISESDPSYAELAEALKQLEQVLSQLEEQIK